MDNTKIDIYKMALNIKLIDKKLEYLIKQLDKNKIKYPLGMTYDELYKSVSLDTKKDFKIVSYTQT